jgi:hypothetical protein
LDNGPHCVCHSDVVIVDLINLLSVIAIFCIITILRNHQGITMPWFQELTEWSNPDQLNHCYLLNDSRSRVYAYVKSGTNTVKEFQNPINFDVRGRKFKKIKDQWNVSINEPMVGRCWTVTGSKGDNYIVSQQNNQWSCSCSGFAFRNRCRHVDQIRDSQK